MSYNTSSYQGINAVDCCFALRKVTRAVTQFYDRHLEPSGIRSTQFTLLLTLTASAGKTLTEMAEGLVMDRTTLTRNLKPLEKEGLITTTKLIDKRTKGYVLTEKGQQAIQKGMPLWQKAQQQITSQLGDDRYKRFLEELRVVRSFANTPKVVRHKNHSE